jgi:hypothetical protein
MDNKSTFIVMKSIQPLIERATEVVSDSVCKECTMQSEDCFPCPVSDEMIMNIVNIILSMQSRFN